MMLTVHNYERYDLTNNPGSSGPGFTIWFSGCTVRCNGCHNQKLWNRKSGVEMTPQQLINVMLDIEQVLNVRYNDVILLGGEPMEQDLMELLELVRGYKKLSKDVWLYTSKELTEIPIPILNECAHIKTGKYDEMLICDGLLATSNQKMWDKIDNKWRIRE